MELRIVDPIFKRQDGLGSCSSASTRSGVVLGMNATNSMHLYRGTLVKDACCLTYNHLVWALKVVRPEGSD